MLNVHPERKNTAMNKRILILCLLLTVPLLSACESSPSATAPCVMVDGCLYFTSNARPEAALPEGYTPAGPPERVKHRPREDMTAQNVADGSELYTNPKVPEAVYIRVPSRGDYLLYKLHFLPPTRMPGGRTEG